MAQPDSPPLPDPDPKTSFKKPRHRHSPSQLAALNELFEQDEHPPLDLRSALAERLGMHVSPTSPSFVYPNPPLRETKTVNAWFQNKRASTKKRSKGVASHDPSVGNPMPGHYPPSSVPPHSRDSLDYHDDEYPPPSSAPYSRASSVLPSEGPSLYYTNNIDPAHFMAEHDFVPRRMRVRPSPEQTEELKKLYMINPHPSAEQRQALSERIGMRYQSITNWFQNQRSLAKKRKEDETEFAPSPRPPLPADYSHDNRQYSAFPPQSSLSFRSLPIQPSSLSHQNLRRSPSIQPMDDISPRRTYPRRSTTPYGSMPISFSRPRRSRPEPYQLDALKDLFRKTPTPTIEERSALALEIGMDVGKVTNWFRNLRQTARKRAKKSGSGEEDEYNHSSYSATASRSGTPSLPSSSSSSSVIDETTDLHVIDDDYDMHNPPSEVGSDDDYQEILTPPSNHSPSPSAPAADGTSNIPRATNINLLNTDPAYYAELEKVSSTRFSGIKIEDALLLLSFHQHSLRT